MHCARTVGEPDAHRVCTTDESDEHRGRKWIRRIASIWRAKLSGESESLATDVLRISITEGSGCEIPGEGGTSARQNSGCEISGWNEWEFPSGCNGAMKLNLTSGSNRPRPWAPRHGLGSRISVGEAHWCSLVNQWWMLLGSKSLDQRRVGGYPVIRGTLRGRRQLVRGGLSGNLMRQAWGDGS